MCDVFFFFRGNLHPPQGGWQDEFPFLYIGYFDLESNDA